MERKKLRDVASCKGRQVIDPTVTVGNVIEILTIALGGLIVFVSLRVTVSDLKESVAEMKADIKALNTVVIRMAVADQRITAIEMDVRELRHGRGFIRNGVEGEWPKDA